MEAPVRLLCPAPVHGWFGASGARPTFGEQEDLPYDPDAIDRVHQVMMAWRREDVAIAAVLLGKRAYFSVVVYVMRLTGGLHPDQPPDSAALVVGREHPEFKVFDVPFYLDPLASPDAVRCCGGPDAVRFAR